MRITALWLPDPERATFFVAIKKFLQYGRVMVKKNGGNAISGSQIELADLTLDDCLLDVDEVRVIEWAVGGKARVVRNVVDGVGLPVLLPVHAFAIRWFQV